MPARAPTLCPISGESSELDDLDLPNRGDLVRRPASLPLSGSGMLLALFNPLLYALDVFRTVIAPTPVIWKHLLDNIQLANSSVNTVKCLIELDCYLLNRLEPFGDWHLIPPLPV
jgi:hypothetical protein